MGWFSVWFFSLVLANLGFAQPVPLNRSAPTDRDITAPVSRAGGVAGQELNRIYTRSIGRGFTVSGQENMVRRGNQININTMGLDRGAAPIQSSFGRSGRMPGFGVGMSRGKKPFSSVSSRPTVSPYMSMFADTLNDSVLPSYTTFTRPQLNQQRFNDQMQRQNLEMERRVQSISARSAFVNPRGSETQAPTGHGAMFSNTGRFYPGNFRRR
jgi:hypothetical protein